MANDILRSADGTTIAYATFGQGPALIAVCGATCDRALMRPTAWALGSTSRRSITTVAAAATAATPCPTPSSGSSRT